MPNVYLAGGGWGETLLFREKCRGEMLLLLRPELVSTSADSLD